MHLNPYQTPGDAASLRLRVTPRFLRPAERCLLTILSGCVYSALCVGGIFVNSTLDEHLPELLFLVVILAEMPFNLSLMLADHMGLGFFTSLTAACLTAFIFAATIHYAVSAFLLSFYRSAQQ